MPVKKSQTLPVYDSISRWLKSVDADQDTTKAASELGTSGSAKDDPGGYMGKSTHPSAKSDDKCGPASMGSRAKENEKDVKKDHGPAHVDNVSPNSGGTQDDKQMHINMNPAATGEDPSVEDDYKGSKEDPGTSHPANAAKLGDKYSSWSLDNLIKRASELGNDILADISVGVTVEADKKASNQVKQSSETKTPVTAEQKTEEVKEAADAGYELAKILGLSKEAADAVAYETVEATIKEALADADAVGPWFINYLNSFQKSDKKAAEEDKDQGEDHALPPGGAMPPDAGAMPPDGGAPAGAEGAEGAPGGGEDAARQQLAMALMELGINSPEELLQMLGAAGGGAPGGAPAGGPPGGMPPGAEGGMMPPDPMAAAQKIASEVMAYKRSGKFRISECKSAAERQERDLMKQYILELIATR